MSSRYEEQEQRREELQYKIELRKIERKGERILRKRELKEKRDSYKKPKNKIQMTKIITWYLFILLNVVLVYSMVVMYLFRDLSYLGVLITDIAAQVTTFLIYTCKSFKETKEEALIKLERDKLNTTYGSDENDEAVG